MESMRELYRHLLAEVYDAERHTLMLLDEVETRLGAPEARSQARNCRAATGRQLEMLERAMELLGGASPQVASAALAGVRDDHRKLVGSAAAPAVLEIGGMTALARASQLTGTMYRTLAVLAASCGQSDAHRLIERAIEEEDTAASQCAGVVARLVEAATPRRGPAVIA